MSQFSVALQTIPISVKEEMDRRAKRLRLSRTDYLKALVL
jgi:hypothetical protein